MVQWLQALAFIPLVFAALMRRIERRALERLRSGGANTAERAILLEHSGRLSDFVYRRLRHAGAIVAAGNDRYYLSEGAYDVFRGRRRRRALIVVALVLAIVATLYVRGDFR
jgi:hypothetical protein